MRLEIETDGRTIHYPLLGMASRPDIDDELLEYAKFKRVSYVIPPDSTALLGVDLHIHTYSEPAVYRLVAEVHSLIRGRKLVTVDTLPLSIAPLPVGMHECLTKALYGRKDKEVCRDSDTRTPEGQTSR